MLFTRSCDWILFQNYLCVQILIPNFASCNRVHQSFRFTGNLNKSFVNFNNLNCRALFIFCSMYILIIFRFEYNIKRAYTRKIIVKHSCVTGAIIRQKRSEICNYFVVNRKWTILTYLFRIDSFFIHCY